MPDKNNLKPSFSKLVPLYEVQSFNTTLEITTSLSEAEGFYESISNSCSLFKIDQSTGLKKLLKKKNVRKSNQKNTLDTDSFRDSLVKRLSKHKILRK